MLNVKSFGLAGGVLWGVSLFLLTIISLLTGFEKAFLEAMTNFYPGYTITWVGSIVGFIWGFLDAFIGCVIFAWLYNMFSKK